MSDNAVRFGSFFSRVEVERSALRIVNRYFSERQLHGLTAAAINAWTPAAKACYPDQVLRIPRVSNVLIRLSERLGMLADQSRAVFAEGPMQPIPSHELLEELAQLCAHR